MKKAFVAHMMDFLEKYFCDGQYTKQTLHRNALLHDARFSDLAEREIQEIKLKEVIQIKESSTFVKRYANLIALIIPAGIVHTIWWCYMVKTKSFGIFLQKAGSNHIPRFYMSITMLFGSFLAGATSEGGGAIAFPVSTLVYHIDPVVARDFSFMSQSVGMTAAAGLIIWMGVLVEWKAVIYGTIGGTVGIIFGLEYVELKQSYAKMYFVCIWGAFAVALYYLNKIKDRRVYLVLDPPHYPDIWKVCCVETLV
jgi:hypothetical protein